MAQPVRIGIVGCGAVMNGPYMSIIRDLRSKGKVEVTIACDVREEKRQHVRDHFGIEQFTTNFEDVVESDNVDLVLILTSMPEHSLVARAGLEAGKHVLVEKPMAVSLTEAANLVEIAKGSPGYLVPAPHVILSPTYQTMWRRIHRGDIGKVLMARARYGWAGPSWGKWFYQPGGGSMFDLGVYNVISLTGWLGPVKRVTAMVGTVIPERIVDGELMKIEADDTAHILLDFGGAVFAVVTTGFTMQRYRSPAIELYGSEGTIQMMGDDWRPRGYELWQNDAGAWQIFEDTDIYWQWTDGLRHLVECINSGTRPIITPEHGYHALEIMLKAQEAGRDGQAKEIESTFTPPDFSDGDKEIKVHLMHDRSY